MQGWLRKIASTTAQVLSGAGARPMKQGWLRSSPCTEGQLQSPVFQKWRQKLQHGPALHRKLWEWCYIAQALQERGLLSPGKRGLGFAVGREPLPALFASFGCVITASDQAQERAAQEGWTNSNEHAAGLEALLHPAVCDPATFRRLVDFLVLDMTRIPTNLRGFDFVWSSCSFEHLGSIPLGLDFLVNSLACVKPGGVAVHTTEYNVSSNAGTLSEGPCVLFRRCDLEEVALRLRRDGHHIEFDFDTGSGPADLVVDRPPYTGNPHLKLELAGYVATSIGVIVTKSRSAA